MKATCSWARKLAYPWWYVKTIVGVLGLAALQEFQRGRKK